MNKEKMSLKKRNLLYSIIDLSINSIMFLKVYGFLNTSGIALSVLYGVYAVIMALGVIMSTICTITLIKIKDDINLKDEYTKQTPTVVPLHNSLIISGISYGFMIASLLQIINHIIFFDSVLETYQSVFLVYLSLQILLKLVSMVLAKVMKYHTIYSWIVDLPCNDRNNKLVEEYKNVLDNMRLDGNIWKGELAKERKKIDKYYYELLQ